MGKNEKKHYSVIGNEGEGKNKWEEKRERKKNGTENEGRKKQIATKWDYRMKTSLVLLLFPFLLFSS